MELSDVVVVLLGALASGALVYFGMLIERAHLETLEERQWRDTARHATKALPNSAGAAPPEKFYW